MARQHQAGVIHQQARFHHGPIPSGDELRIYEETVPGTADRIIRMAEQQAEHRQDLEQASLASDSLARERQLEIEQRRIDGIITNERIGQLSGWTVAICCVSFAGFCASHGASPVTVALFLSLPVVGVVKAFVRGRPDAGGTESAKTEITR